MFQNNHSAIVHCNTAVADVTHIIKRHCVLQSVPKMCATLQCYKVKDQLSVANDAQLLFEVTFKEGADCSDDQLFPFSRYHVLLRLLYFAICCMIQMFLDKV